MTENTAGPGSTGRIVLSQIAPDAWEHPADRAALNALRKVPEFDEAGKRIFGFFGEGGIRLLFQANAVRCGPRQFPRLHGLLAETRATMDWPEEPGCLPRASPPSERTSTRGGAVSPSRAPEAQTR